MVHTCHLGAWEVEASIIVQGHLFLLSKSEVSLGYLRLPQTVRVRGLELHALMRLSPHILYLGGVDVAPMSSIGLKDLPDLCSYMNLELFTKC